MFIEILFKMLLFKGGVLIYAEHCIYIYIYIYMYVYIYDGMRVERMEFPFNPFPCIFCDPMCCILIVVVTIGLIMSLLLFL